VSPIPVVLHPLQTRVEEVVIPVQCMVNPTLCLEDDTSFKHGLNIPNNTPSEHKIFFLSSGYLPPCPEEVPFDWDGLVGFPMPPSMSFPVRDIIRYIIETITSASSLSSSTWRDLGFSKLMSAIRKMLTFHRSLAQEPWHPP
jgi:hypothetical protein